MRLIDADALKEAIEQGEGFSWDSHGKDDLCVRKKYIDNATTINEKKILYLCKYHKEPHYCKHTTRKGKWGKWVIIEIQCPNYLEYFQTDCYSMEELQKCPNCEADMRGDSNDG